MPLAVGDIVFALFPYQEENADQEHPVVILIPDLPANSALVCCVTTKKNKFDTCIEITRKDFLGGGMNKWPSYARPYRLATINTQHMRRKLGQLKLEAVKKIISPTLNCLNKI